MTDRPIPFVAPMVRAILREIENPGTGKTQDRRVLKPQPLEGMLSDGTDQGVAYFATAPNRAGQMEIEVPAIGDRLWVREAWKTDRHYDDLAPREMGCEEPIIYLADNAVERWGWRPGALSRWGRYRQAMHMPRWASRITLTVADVRVQRVQDINLHDVYAEGIAKPNEVRMPLTKAAENILTKRGLYPECDPFAMFSFLWNSLNEARGHGWEANPWVYALTFVPELRNIDA